MRHIVLTPALLLACMIPVLAADFDRVWPPIPPWQVVMMPGRDSRVCTAFASPGQDGSYAIVAAFAFSLSTTHFYIQLDGTNLPLPPTRLTLLADDKPIYTAVTEIMAGAPPGRLGFRIDLPGDVLARVVVPRLRHAGTLGVHAGEVTSHVPVRNFGAVYDQLAECARNAIASSRP